MVFLLDELPPPVRRACADLRSGLLELLGEDLMSLWAHGAVIASDRPLRLGDVDTHAVVRVPVTSDTVRAIDELHETTSGSAVEWDSWYVLEEYMASPNPPPHVLRERFVDRSWALHRAHWLAGRYVSLHGRPPDELVRPPEWGELEEALRNELAFIARVADQRSTDVGEAAFAVWNASRIVYSMRLRDVVVSKRAASRWALEHLPNWWRGAVLAAGRVYDGTPEPEDTATLQAALGPVVDAVRAEFA